MTEVILNLLMYFAHIVLLNKSGLYPGPGSYMQPNLVGVSQSSGNSSRVKSSQKFGFPKANDRFRVPSNHDIS